MVREEQLQTLFRDMAKTIADQYIHDIAAHHIILGKKPEFDELMAKLKQLDKELTDKAIQLIDRYKKESGNDTDHLTNNFKDSIAVTISDFVKKL